MTKPLVSSMAPDLTRLATTTSRLETCPGIEVDGAVVVAVAGSVAVVGAGCAAPVRVQVQLGNKAEVNLHCLRQSSGRM